nr:hypothetical protein HK105_002190 [Polyrhizophydium stewartii]
MNPTRLEEELHYADRDHRHAHGHADAAAAADSLLTAIKTFFGPESHRFARMSGAFAFLWKLINNALHKYRADAGLGDSATHSKANGAIAGAVAGLAILFESEDNRIGFSQQLFMRSMQAGYNALHARNLLHIPHGDTLLFSAACASIMYAYIMHPTTIPKSYYSWMVRTARVPADILQFNRTSVKAWQHHAGAASTAAEAAASLPAPDFAKLQVDRAELSRVLTRYKAPAAVGEFLDAYLGRHAGTMPTVPCKLVHCSDISCVRYNAALWFKVFWNILPVYVSLNGVPLMLFKTKALMENPRLNLFRALKSSARSSTFLAFFVFLFQSGICLQRNARPNTRDSRFYYYLLGAISGLTVLLEHPSRRVELAMYTLPKGIQSLYTVLINRGNMVPLYGVDVVASCVAMAVIMSVYQVEPHQMSPLLYRTMRAVIGTY